MSFEKKFVTGEVLQQVTQGVRDKIKGEIIDNLESTDINKPLSANQGKILQDTKLGKNEKHEQTSDTITSMTGYEKVGNGVVLPTDSLNQAIGKLEVKADKALDVANNAIPKDNIVNDLTTGGTDSVLSAEQGKVLKQLINSVSGDGGAGGGLIENAKSFNKIVYNGTLTANGRDIVVGKTLYNPSLYLDGTRIDVSEYELNAKVGQITLKQPYAKYEVSWEVEDQLPNHIRFSYPTLDLLINDESIKSIINIGDVIEIQGTSDADDGGHRLVKCEDSSKLNGVQIGEGKYLNEIPNTRTSEKLDKGSVSVEYDTAEKIENKIKQRLIIASTIEELKTMNSLKEGDIVEVLGYYSSGDGAGHKRVITNKDDGSGVGLNSGLWANIVHNGEVSISWFGAKGDGVFDNTEIFKKVIGIGENKKLKIKIPPKSYLVTDSLVMRRGLILEGETTIYDGVSSKIILQSSEDIPLIDTPYYDGVGPTVSVRCFLKNLYLVNKGYSQNPEENIINTGIRWQATTECVIENVSIIGFGTGCKFDKVQINVIKWLTVYYTNTVFDCLSGSTLWMYNSNTWECNTIFKNIGAYTIQGCHFEEWRQFMVIDGRSSTMTTCFRDCNIASNRNTTFITATQNVSNMMFDSCIIKNNQIENLIDCQALGYFYFNRCVVFGIRCYLTSNTSSSITFVTSKTDSLNYDGSGPEKPKDTASSALSYYIINEGALSLNTGIELGIKRKSGIYQMYLDNSYAIPRWETRDRGNYLLSLLQSGSTQSRPTRAPGLILGSCYFDTTLGKPIWWNGSNWVDASGAVASSNEIA